MLRMLARGTLAAAVLVTVPLAGTASADVTVPGCYGAATVVYCDPTVTATVPYTVESYETTVPVCAGTCYDVPVTLLSLEQTGAPLAVCATRYSQAGVPTTTCASIPAVPDTQELVDLVQDAAGLVVGAVTECLDEPTTGVCRSVDFYKDRATEEWVPNVLDLILDTLP